MTSLKSLEEVDLSRTSITDASAQVLHQLSNLKQIWIDRTNLTSEGKKLLGILQTPVANSAYNAIIAQADYRVGAAHLLDMIHEILEKNKAIEQSWTATKSQLNQKLGLRLFQKDVLQVSILFLVCRFTRVPRLLVSICLLKEPVMVQVD